MSRTVTKQTKEVEMKISEKDRGQLLRMAGNIACGLAMYPAPVRWDEAWERVISESSARIARMTLEAVDREIESANKED